MNDCIREEDLCLNCLQSNCWNCKYEIACQNFCEKHIVFPAVLTDTFKGVEKYDGDEPDRIWDNIP